MSKELYYAHADKFYYQSPDESYENYRRLFVKNLESKPYQGIIALSGSEMETDVIFGPLMKDCQPWCEANNKKFYVMTPSQLHNCKYPNEEYPHVEWIEFHGYDMYLYENIWLEESKIPLPLQNPTKLFVCYNNREDVHRDMLLDKLKEHNMLDKGTVTYRLSGNPEYKALSDEDNFKLSERKEWECCHFPQSYFGGFVDIVTESRYLPGEHYMSEKTFKPISGLKPFLAVAPQGYHAWLERKGVKKYNIFDYSFDDEPKLEDRIEGIIQNLIRLDSMYKTPEDYSNMLKELEPDMQRNFDTLMHNIRHGRFLTNPIIDYLKPYHFPIPNELLTKDIRHDVQMYYEFLHTKIVR